MKNISCWKKAYESDLECIATEIRELVERPAVIVLSGVVGAGKTTFTKKFISHLDVTSPTYSIINEVGNTLHADFFRINEIDEIAHLELPIYADGKDYIVIEWGQDYMRDIERELGDDYFYYLLRIELSKQDLDDSDDGPRSYYLDMVE